MRIDQDGKFRLAQHVDEAGGDSEAVGIDGARGFDAAENADGRDAAVADADVAGIPGRTGAVDDVTVDNDKVERRLR